MMFVITNRTVRPATGSPDTCSVKAVWPHDMSVQPLVMVVEAVVSAPPSIRPIRCDWPGDTCEYSLDNFPRAVT
jgi:hypothetical protein